MDGTDANEQRFRASTAEEKLILRLRQLAKTGTFQIAILTVNPLAIRVYSQIERLDGVVIRAAANSEVDHV